MTIAEAREKCKGALAKIPRDIPVVAVLVLSSSLSFWLGYQAGLDATTLTAPGVLEPISELSTGTAGQVVASRSGTKYYLPTCAGAARISDANKVWFATVELAAAAGYSPAANCKGL